MPDFSAIADGCPLSLQKMQELASSNRCVKRPVPVNFFVAEEEMTLYRNRGSVGVNVQHAGKGDIIIVNDDEAWVVTPEYFAKNYDMILSSADYLQLEEVNNG